jgi:hypothetical protein
LIYPRFGNIAHNIQKFRYDPPKLANVWQKIQSVHSPVCLDGKSVTCVARDRFRHFSYPKYHRLFIPCVRVFFPLFFISRVCIWSPLGHSPVLATIFLISFSNSSARTRVFQVGFWFSTLLTCFRTFPRRCNHRALLQRTRSLQGVGQLQMQSGYVIAGHRLVR